MIKRSPSTRRAECKRGARGWPTQNTAGRDGRREQAEHPERKGATDSKRAVGGRGRHKKSRGNAGTPPERNRPGENPEGGNGKPSQGRDRPVHRSGADRPAAGATRPTPKPRSPGDATYRSTAVEPTDRPGELRGSTGQAVPGTRSTSPPRRGDRPALGSSEPMK